MKSHSTARIIRVILFAFIFVTVLLGIILFSLNGFNKIMIPAILFLLFFVGIVFFILKKNKKAIHVLETGNDAKVTILEILDQETNMLLHQRNDHFKWLLLKLKVECKGQAAYEIVKKLSFHHIDIKWVKPGIVVPAKVAQEDSSDIQFLWVEYKKSMNA